LKDSVDNIRGKLQEIKDMQPQKSISFGKATNPIEGLETQIWFGRMQLILNTMMKLGLSMSKKSIFGNDKIWTISTLLRLYVMKRRKWWKNDEPYQHYWGKMLWREGKDERMMIITIEREY